MSECGGGEPEPAWAPPPRIPQADLSPAPPEWPHTIPAPGTPGWHRAAVTWLLEYCPPGYRTHPVLREHPVIAGRLAWQHVTAGLTALRHGYANTRVDLKDTVPVHGLDAVLECYQEVGSALLDEAAAVAAVTRALRDHASREPKKR